MKTGIAKQLWDISLSTDISNIDKKLKTINKKKPSSTSHSALKYALLTDRNNIPPKTMDKINLLTKKYWIN